MFYTAVFCLVFFFSFKISDQQTRISNRAVWLPCLSRTYYFIPIGEEKYLHGCVIKALRLFYDFVSMATLLYCSFKVPALAVSND